MKERTVTLRMAYVIEETEEFKNRENLEELKNKFYVVWKGRTPGVYDNWEACKQEIDGFACALYKGFPDKTSAEAAFAKGFTGFENAAAKPNPMLATVKPFSPAIAVDAACSGNPGKMEYQGVFVDFGITWLCKELLHLNKNVANAMGFRCAATSNFFLNRMWTFEGTAGDTGTQYMRFLLISVIGLGINSLTVYLLHGKFKCNFYLSKLFATGVVTFWNFFMNYFFNF